MLVLLCMCPESTCTDTTALYCSTHIQFGFNYLELWSLGHMTHPRLFGMFFNTIIVLSLSFHTDGFIWTLLSSKNILFSYSVFCLCLITQAYCMFSMSRLQIPTDGTWDVGVCFGKRGGDITGLWACWIPSRYWGTAVSLGSSKLGLPLSLSWVKLEGFIRGEPVELVGSVTTFWAFLLYGTGNR